MINVNLNEFYQSDFFDKFDQKPEFADLTQVFLNGDFASRSNKDCITLQLPVFHRDLMKSLNFLRSELPSSLSAYMVPGHYKAFVSDIESDYELMRFTKAGILSMEKFDISKKLSSYLRYWKKEFGADLLGCAGPTFMVKFDVSNENAIKIAKNVIEIHPEFCKGQIGMAADFLIELDGYCEMFWFSH